MIGQQLTFVDSTCIEWLQSRKSRTDNTSGFRGVSGTANGRWRAGIGLQRRHYYLGTYDTFEAAVQARLGAEALLHDGFVRAYRAWEQTAAEDPRWSERHPFFFRVTRENGTFSVESAMDAVCR